MNYEGWGMMPAQDFMYPIEYHERYGYMYPSMEPEMNNGMVNPIMYPDIYYRIYPHVHRTCDRMDNPYMLYPSEAQVESMVDDCYDNCVRAMPDLIQYADMNAEATADVDTSQFRRRPLLRDLIAIILISELFRRRRSFGRFSYGSGSFGDYGGYYGGGYGGYGQWYGPEYGSDYNPGAGYGY